MIPGKPKPPIPPMIVYIGSRDEFVQAYFVRDTPNFQCTAFTKREPASLKDLQDLRKAVIDTADWVQLVSSKMSDPYFAKHSLAPQKYTSRMGGGGIYIPILPTDLKQGLLIEGGKTQVPDIWYSGGHADPSTGGIMVRWGRFEAAIELAISLLSPKK